MVFDKYGYDRRATLRAMNLGATLQKTDRILTGNGRITVRVDPNSGSTFSVADDIHIGTEKLSLSATRDLLAVMGQNYHEVSHVLFTPRMNSYELSWIRQNADGSSQHISLQAAFNFLEEARIETLFGAQYPKAKHFFTVMVSKLLLGKYENADSVMDATQSAALGYTPEQSHAIFTHLLVYGRRYLPSDIRDAVREYAEDVLDGNQAELQKITDAEAILDEYRLLPTSKIKTRGKELAILLSNIYPGFFEAVEQNDGGQGQSRHQPFASKGGGKSAPSNSPEQEEAAKKAQQDEKDGYEEIELDDDAGGGSGSDDEEESDEDEDSDGDGDDDGEADDGDSQDGSGQNGGQKDGDQTGNGAGTSTDASPSDGPTLREILEGVAQAIARDSRVRKDVQDVQDALDAPTERGLDTWIDSRRLPTAEEQETGRRLGREFERLAQEVSPGWNYGSDTGKLNVQRALNPDADPESIFDEWDEGREQDASIELTFLVDMSGSMGGGRIQGASSFVWTVAEALKDLDAKVTVYGFSNVGEVYTLRGRDDEHSAEVKEFTTVGGTNPAFAMNAAKALLNTSDHPNRALVVFTDGQWSPNEVELGHRQPWNVRVSDTYAPLLNEIKAHKTLIGIGMVGMGTGGYFDELAEHFDVAAQCNKPTDLLEPVLRTIEMMVRAHLHA